METAKTAILVGVAVVLLIAIAFVATLGRRGKIVAVLLVVVGLGGGAFKYLSWRGDSGKRQAIVVTVGNYLHDKRPMKELPSDQLEWLFSKAGWSPEDLPKIDSLAQAEAGQAEVLRLLDKRLNREDGISLEIIESVYGPNWQQDAEEEKALTLRIRAAVGPFSARGRQAVQDSDPVALVDAARAYDTALTPLGEEWVAMRRRQRPAQDAAQEADRSARMEGLRREREKAEQEREAAEREREAARRRKDARKIRDKRRIELDNRLVQKEITAGEIDELEAIRNEVLRDLEDRRRTDPGELRDLDESLDRSQRETEDDYLRRRDQSQVSPPR